jgi:hypothetical protein
MKTNLNVLRTMIAVILAAIFTPAAAQCDTATAQLQSFMDFATPQQLAASGSAIPGNGTVTLCYEFNRPGPYSGYFLLSYFTPTNFVNYTINVYVYDTSCTLVSVGQEFLYDENYTGSYTVCYTITTWGQAPTINILPYFIYFTPLAAEWGSVEAIQYGQGIRVAFVTLSETNVDYFTVQVSEDLLNWESFNRLQGQGNKSTSTSYSSFVPWDKAVKKVVYVRAEETDFNGVSSYSPVAPVLLVIDPQVFDRLNGFDLSGRRLK